MIAVPAWCAEVAESFRAAESTLVIPAQLVNDRDAALAWFTVRMLALGGPEADRLIEDIDRVRTGLTILQPQETR